MNVKRLSNGKKRQWVRCKRCSKEYYYDYIPYSFSNPIMTLPCNHGSAESFNDSVENIDGPTAPAIIYVDGEEFIRCEKDDNFVRLFNETVNKIGGEVDLMVWKPQYKIYFKERHSLTAPKK